jgi:hypothetical protein
VGQALSPARQKLVRARTCPLSALPLQALCDYLEVPRPNPTLADDSPQRLRLRHSDPHCGQHARQYRVKRPIHTRYSFEPANNSTPTADAAKEQRSNLTLTERYNVLEELRAAQTLNPASQSIYDHGLIAVLRELHDDLDLAVADAYGWPADLSAEDVLFRLVELNVARGAASDF